MARGGICAVAVGVVPPNQLSRRPRPYRMRTRLFIYLARAAGAGPACRRHAPLPSRLSLQSAESHSHRSQSVSRSFRLFVFVTSFRFRNKQDSPQHAYLQRLSLSTLHLLCPVFGCLLKRRAARSRGDSFGRKIYLLLLTQSRRDAPTRIAQVIIPRLATHLHLTAHAIQILSMILGVLEVEEPAAFMGDGRGSGRGAGGVALGEPGRGGVELGDPCLDC